jgi:hypothetical protein
MAISFRRSSNYAIVQNSETGINVPPLLIFIERFLRTEC